MRRIIAAGPPLKRPPQSGFGAGSSGRSASLATIGLALLLVVSAASAAEERIRLGEFIPVTTPQPAPAAVFTDLDGMPVSLADFRGKPAVVNLWATWCQPCLKEMPTLLRLHAQLGDRLIIAAVSQDRGGAKVVAPFVAEKGLGELAIYLDPKNELAHEVKLRGLPTSLVLDAQGRLLGRVEGEAEWDGEAMRAILRPLLDTAADPVKKMGG